MLRIDMIIADAAQTAQAEGKAHVLGAGWSVVRGEAPMAVVVFIEVPWDESNRPFSWALELHDSDGQPVSLPGPAGPQILRIEGGLEAGRPPGLPQGTPLMQGPISVNLGPLPLEAGRYEWRFFVDGATDDRWRRSFTKLAGSR